MARGIRDSIRFKVVVRAGGLAERIEPPNGVPSIAEVRGAPLKAPRSHKGPDSLILLREGVWRNTEFFDS